MYICSGHWSYCNSLGGVILQEGKSALHVAAAKGHLKVVDVLLTSNADPNSETTVSTKSLD